MPQDVALLHNPGAGKDALSTATLQDLLRRAGFRPRVFSLPDQIDDPAVLSAGDFVIAAGGDGTLRRAALRLAHTGKSLAPLPLGTANNIAGSLGIHGTPEQIIAGWRTPTRRAIDLGLARGPWGEQRFIEGVGVGLVGRAIAIIESIAEVSAHEYEGREDELHRDLCVFLTLAHEMAPLGLTLTVDGQETRDAFLLLEILNVPRAGPRLELAAGADLSDGLLDVISVTTAEREKLKENLRKHLAGASRDPLLAARRARTIRITTSNCDLRLDDQLMLRCDTDNHVAPEPFTVDIRVEPRALEILLSGHAG